MHKSSQTEGFHHFFLTKRDSTTLFGLLGAVFLKGVFKTHGIYVGSRFRGIKKKHVFMTFGPLGGSWAVLGPSWGPSLGSFSTLDS